MRPHRLAGLLASAIIATSAAAQPDGANPVRFDGHRVVSVRIDDARDLQTALALTDDVWSHHTGVGGSLDIRVSPEQFAALEQSGLEFRVAIPDLQARIDEETASVLGARANRGMEWFESYKNLDEINARLDALAAAHPDLAQTFTVGTSLQGRPIRGLRVTAPGDPSGRQAVIYHGCQHAREWITPMTVMWIAERLLEGHATDPEVQQALATLEFHLVPVSNPDGYVYTWTNNRLWRKNRRDNGNGTFGVDINRNWGYQWGTGGSSGTPSSETYRGPAPFSEPETQALRDYIQSLPRLRAHFDVHSYGQLILSPWGYTDEPPPSRGTFAQINGLMESAIEGVFGTQYTAGPTYTTIYPVSGGSTDWSFGAEGLLSWGFELRDTGQNGFVLPAAQIIPTGTEMFEGVMAFSEYLSQPLGFAFPDGLPAYLSPTEPTSILVEIQNLAGTMEPGSAAVLWRVGSGGPFASVPLAPAGGTTFVATLPPVACGQDAEFYFQAQAMGGAMATEPEDGAASPLSLTSQTLTIAVEDTMEASSGWTVGAPGDTAVRGLWNRMDPQGTEAQPENDHTAAPGVNCWVTDGAAGNGIGANDIDGGATTLTSPGFSSLPPSGSGEAFVSYWRWYSNDRGASPGEDSMPILISADDGATWTQLELVTENANAWVQRSFRVSDFVTPSAQMRLRVVARDEEPGSVVEAALDDLRVTIAGCPCPADIDGDGVLTLSDFVTFRNLYTAGSMAADFDGSGGLTLNDFVQFRNAYAAGCP